MIQYSFCLRGLESTERTVHNPLFVFPINVLCTPVVNSYFASLLLRRVRLDLLAYAFVLLADLWRHLRVEVFELEHLTNLELALFARVWIRALPRPLDRFGKRIAFPHPKPPDQFLRFCEWAVDHRPLVAGETNTSTLRAGLQTITRKHDARLDEFLIVFAHRFEHFRRRQFARFRIFGGFYNHHESHVRIPCILNSRV